MKNEELKNRTKQFAHGCAKLALELPEGQLRKHIGGELIRSSSSVATNYIASCTAQSRKSFISKLSTVLEEADEALFWLEFIIDEQLVKTIPVEPLLNEARDLRAIFHASLKTE